MRTMLGLGLLIATAAWPRVAAAGSFGWVGGGCGGTPAVVVPSYPAWPAGPAYSPYPYGYPAYGYPYAYAYPGPSYFRPDLPPGWNAQRNWRDTWQDDGVKVHGYTWR